MYESLEMYCKDFHLYIFAFDEQSYQLLNKRNLKYATIISLDEFENEKLLSVKEGRTKGEYCWTSTSSTIKYCLDNYNLNSCTYLDADLYFFADPKVLLDEVKDGSTLITEHRYTKKYDQSKSSGKYCVQFITFHNNSNSLKILNWWVDACIDWCYAKAEDGKFGDQKYLDNWKDAFSNVHELEHLGGGVAPWNVQQYNFYKKDGIRYGIDIKSKKEFDLIFFHFHDLKFLEDSKINLGLYSLNSNVLELIYKPYIIHLDKINSEYNKKIIKQNKIVKTNSLKYILKRVLDDKSSILRFVKRFFEQKNIYKINKITGN